MHENVYKYMCINVFLTRGPCGDLEDRGGDAYIGIGVRYHGYIVHTRTLRG